MNFITSGGGDGEDEGVEDEWVEGSEGGTGGVPG